jgi:hypothetical protein
VEKNLRWVKSLSVVMAVLIVMAAAGFYLLSGEEATVQGGKVEAASLLPVEVQQSEETAENVKTVEEELEAVTAEEAAEQEEEPQQSAASASEDKTKEPALADESDFDLVTAEKDKSAEPIVVNTTSAPTDHKAKAESAPVETVTEAPAAQPAAEEVTITLEEPQLTAVPVTYNWGSSANYFFRIEVKVTNNGNETANNVNVSVPLLENSSPYQTTTLRSANFEIVSSSGRVSTFNLGTISPGETKTIIVDFDLNVRTLSLSSSNNTVDQARKIYEQYAGSGNCRELALAFISKCRDQGITAREVIGFARPQRGAMSAGSLQGCRHSWAEFYVDGLGWVPVDLTFQYFGALPHTSHLVESYSDQSIKVTYTGGSIGASWSNAVL